MWGIRNSRPTWAACALILLSVVGCMGGASMPARFYMFNPVAPTAVGQTNLAGRIVRVGIEQVEIPRYLDRPQIVTLNEGVEYHIDEFNQWLEPLSANLTRVVAENLSEMLGAEEIDILSGLSSLKTEYRITVQVLRLDGQPGRHAILVARWALFGQDSNAPLFTKRCVEKETLSDDSFQSFVKAQNLMVESLSRDIGDAIRAAVLNE